jgi:glucokinase
MILAGDIGGTKTTLALFEEAGGDLQPRHEATFPSQEYQSFEQIVAKFLGPTPDRSLRAVCLGVAGPVMDGRCETTNLPWILDERTLARLTGATRVKLLNDLEAAAYGMLHLRPHDLHVLNQGRQPQRPGNIAVIAAGTGLGEAMLYWDGVHYHPIATEGGHADFAPSTDQEAELLPYLRGKFGDHVSYERVLSGPGLQYIYAFLRDRGYAHEPSWLADKPASGDPSATITEIGLAGADPLCVATLDLFTSIYGAEAGNLALKCLALGGVFVGGGIAPKVLPALQQGNFMHAFMAKGRFSDLMASLEVRVALNPQTALVGAARYALRIKAPPVTHPSKFQAGL